MKSKFILIQDDKTKKTFVYEEKLGWVEQPKEYYTIWTEQHETIRKYPSAFMQMMDLS